MVSRALPAVGAAAFVVLCLASGCASAGFSIPTGDVLSTVVRSIPVIVSTTSGSRSGSGSGSAPVRRIPSSPAPSAKAAQILATANSYVGVRYTWGGNTPREGFDCSGFTKYVFAARRITLPRTSREQAAVGTKVAADFRALVPGDLMFFAEPGQAISHVAIYAGNGQIIHASSSVGGVGYTDLNRGGEWFVDYFVAARRVE